MKTTVNEGQMLMLFIVVLGSILYILPQSPGGLCSLFRGNLEYFTLGAPSADQLDCPDGFCYNRIPFNGNCNDHNK